MKRMFNFFKDYCANFVEIQKKHGIAENNIEEFNAKMLTYPAYNNGGRFVLVEASVFGVNENTPNTQAMYVPIDEGICDAIIELNKNGYRTEYCCEGHKDKYGEYSTGYIMFDMLCPEKNQRPKRIILETCQSWGYGWFLQ